MVLDGSKKSGNSKQILLHFQEIEDYSYSVFAGKKRTKVEPSCIGLFLKATSLIITSGLIRTAGLISI